MCGIIGFSWEDSRLARKMALALEHRGPDDSGIYTDKGISLGHRRLSILDLSKRGHQPMFNEDGTIAVVFNGEIYNYKQIKGELESRGHVFKSETDTEVIVHGYEEYGDKISGMFEGMFAFALWDSKKKRLVLSRDRIGEKPLYYYLDREKIIFASEIKAILTHGEIEPEINYQCLSDYLTLRYSTGNETMFKGINKLPVASTLIYESGSARIKKHWEFPKFTSKNIPDVKKVDELISQAIERRLMADVPIGVFLSGGLDSGSIVAYMSRFTDKINTFSVGFGDSTDETDYAKIVAERYGTKHQTIKLDSNKTSLLPKIVWHFDEPLADPAALPTYLLCEEVSKKVKVALSGEGGDEVFGGYHTFNYLPQLQRYHKIPKVIRKNIIGNGLRISSKIFNYPKKQILELGAEISKESDSVVKSQEKLFYFPFDEKDKAVIMSNKIKSGISMINPLQRYISSNENLWTGTQEYYFKDWLPNDLLMKADKMSMAHGLEVRPPFLDTDLINYFAGLDVSHKLNRKLFRKTVEPLLPKTIMEKKKQGFTLPISSWFRKKEFSEKLMPQLEDLGKRGWFELKSYRKIIDNPKEFRNDHRMWVLLNLELWSKIYLDKKNYRSIKI